MKDQLTVHIGMHKTGTSTIQAQLVESRSSLRSQGILYAETGRQPFPQHPKHSSLFKSLVLGPAEFQKEFDIVMREYQASGCSTLVLSEEAFSSPYFDKFNFRLFKKFLPHFDIRVVCFLRRQDTFAESLWNQHTKIEKQSKDITGFLEVPKNRLRFDYVGMLDFWANFAEVVAVGFEGAVQKGLEKTFSAASGVPILTSSKLRNVSPGMNCAATMALLNRLDVKFDAPKLIAAFSHDKRKHVLGSALRRKLLDEVADHNKKLYAKYGVSFSDSMPEEGSDPLLLPDVEEIAKAIAALSIIGPRSKQLRTPLTDMHRNQKTH